jgi:hypothetical protein
MAKSTNKRKAGDHYCHVPPTYFVKWLESGIGRAAYFGKVDPLLTAPLISKIKRGRMPITFEYACRLERAQKPSDMPIRAIDLMTFEQDRALYLYITGQEAAPAPPAAKNKMPGRKQKHVELAPGA